jgi:hypothetical protein
MGTNRMPPIVCHLLLLNSTLQSDIWKGDMKQQLGSASPKCVLGRFLDGFVIFEDSEQELLTFVGVLNSTLFTCQAAGIKMASRLLMHWLIANFSCRYTCMEIGDSQV